jgi:hypothetical protein
MPSKPLDLAMEAAKAFIKDMRAFHAETSQTKAHEIAARQMAALQQYRGAREKPLRVTDVIKMSRQMKDQA